MRIHFIAIGGAAMHNLALALINKGYKISGSDDEIFEPSRSRLENAGLLPEKFGWFPTKITTDIDAVILGMHARKDNLELLRAQDLGLKIYSYPEFLFEQTKNKKRVVVGGSHGKTTITSMIMHVLKDNRKIFDYMVGSQIEGFETMVSLDENTSLAVFEGDEYLSSPIDLRPKFHLYKPHIAIINGVAWDHINVFPTFDIYKEQFALFIDKIESGGTLYYNQACSETCKIVNEINRVDIKVKSYKELPSRTEDNKSSLLIDQEKQVALNVFGKHNLENMAGAKAVCNELGIADEDFYNSIARFSGSKKRMQKLHEDNNSIVYLDFAHAPSKVDATVRAIRSQFPERQIVAMLELHTFSSLNKEFIEGYKNSLEYSDNAIVFYNPEVVAHKKLPKISSVEIFEAFKKKDLQVVTSKEILKNSVKGIDVNSKTVFLFMSSGNFGGLSIENMVELTQKKNNSI